MNASSAVVLATSFITNNVESDYMAASSEGWYTCDNNQIEIHGWSTLCAIARVCLFYYIMANKVLYSYSMK